MVAPSTAPHTCPPPATPLTLLLPQTLATMNNVQAPTIASHSPSCPLSNNFSPSSSDPHHPPSTPSSPPQSKYRGVVWDPDSGRWRAQLLNDGRPVILGHFGTQEEAARQYDMAVVKGNRKERTNFPPSFYKDG